MRTLHTSRNTSGFAHARSSFFHLRLRPFLYLLAVTVPSLFLTHAEAKADNCSDAREGEQIGLLSSPHDLTSIRSPTISPPIDIPKLKYVLTSPSPGQTLASLATSKDFQWNEFATSLLYSLNNGLDPNAPIPATQHIAIFEPNQTDSTASNVNDITDDWLGLANTAARPYETDKLISNSLYRLDNLKGYTDSPDRGSIASSLNSIGAALNTSKYPATTFPALEKQLAAYQGARSINYLIRVIDPSSPTTDQEMKNISVFASATATTVSSLGLGRVQLIVHTKTGNGSPVNGLTVYRASYFSDIIGCRETNKVRFDTLSYSAKALLPSGLYVVWVESLGKPISKPLTVSLPGPEEREMDIVVSKSGH
jgi:hypothetical protein